MKALRQFLFACVAVFCLTGCLQVEKLVKLNADGSGTVEETFTMSKTAIKTIQAMADGFAAGKGEVARPYEVLNEARIKESVANMGEGVRLVSATKVSSDQGEGYKAIFAFTDINKLKVDQNPSSSMPPASGTKKKDEKKEEPIVFKLAKGSPGELVMTMPAPQFEPRKEPSPEADESAMQTARQMFKDMKIKMAVEVAGAIQETNAEYRDGARVTLMELDMDKLLADPVKFKELAKASPRTLQEAKALLKGVEGAKVETAPEVKIKFQ